MVTETDGFYLLVSETVEDEDEDALQTVEDGEQIGKDECVLVDVQKTEWPSQAQQYNQHCCTLRPCPAQGVHTYNTTSE